ncbi:hypothetical protein Talka_02330 [Tepidimonas alkaliphilus]|uniref:Uncharacterized protein n=1 Tax=Tepidimonas alkaliphilus TaxID=2588942 RepID=A0A554W3K9_9BURK|nr:hypothetical protein [Tepidimonas alkaliphilus]TSE18162.1 hypothetical protein Talka_02330 [Tepidimonas alkaliphilus]
MIRWLEKRVLAWLPPGVQARLRGAHAANKAFVRSAFWLAMFVLAAKLVAGGWQRDGGGLPLRHLRDR